MTSVLFSYHTISYSHELSLHSSHWAPLSQLFFDSSTCRETADITSRMFKKNNNKEFALVKIYVMGSVEMLSKYTYFACWQAAKLSVGSWLHKCNCNCELMY
jgi:hypothetical protein